MKWLITGLNGTLAPQVASVARAKGIEVLAWDRAAVNPDEGHSFDLIGGPVQLPRLSLRLPLSPRT